MKLKELLQDLKKKNIFGQVIAMVHVIEFQKRGLPHAHMLIILRNEDKPHTVSLIDKIVSAEIPNKETHPRLFEVVTKNMIHGPCNTPNSRSPCLEGGKCRKGFPKPFQNETVASNNGYPLYMRRQRQAVKTNNNVEVENSWVVPYNPFLSLKYNCHINVEVCASIKSVKYLYKYAYKGHDCASIELQTNKSDELKKHVDTRYVSPPEAAWRIFKFSMHEQTHSINVLAVHLPDQQNVNFQPENIESAIERAGNKESTLMAWFTLNNVDATARQYKYTEIPEHFMFNKAQGKWTTRKQGFGSTIGRMHGASVRDAERYFLRLLLLHVRGAKGYHDLRRYNEIEYPTFYEAAQARGLVENENAWDDALTEASLAKLPKQLRELFAYSCIFGMSPNVSNLWNKHKDNLVEDFALKHKHPAIDQCQIYESYALRDIADILITQGKRCSDYGLRNPPRDLPSDLNTLEEIEKERTEGEQLRLTLNNEQQIAFDSIIEAMNSKNHASKAFFLDGPGGSGKTHLYKTLLSVTRGQGKTALPVASTGIAANLLRGGRTSHSQYKLPLKINEVSISGVKVTSDEAKMIKASKILIWDEAQWHMHMR